MSIGIKGLKEGDIIEFFKDTRVEFDIPITFSKGTRALVIKGGKKPIIQTEMLNDDLEFVGFQLGHSFFEKNCNHAKPVHSIGLDGYVIRHPKSHHTDDGIITEFELIKGKQFVATMVHQGDERKDHKITFYGEDGKHLESVLRLIMNQMIGQGYKPVVGSFEQIDIERFYVDYIIKGFDQGMMKLEKFIDLFNKAEAAKTL